jgi:hypothetical protein
MELRYEACSCKCPLGLHFRIFFSDLFRDLCIICMYAFDLNMHNEVVVVVLIGGPGKMITFFNIDGFTEFRFDM